ncbi:MAG: condensation domain-containing protein [Knoellia sp.]
MSGATGAAADVVRFPFSMIQQAWGEMCRSAPGFIVSDTIRIRGPLDPALLQLALDDLVVRHGALRTTVAPGADEQVVHPHGRIGLEVRHHDGLGPAEREDAVRDVVVELDRRHVRVDSLPVAFAVLDRLGPDDALFTLGTHHFLCDGASLHLMFADLSELYAARLHGRLADLPEPGVFRDYVMWETEHILSDEYRLVREQWREALEGAQMLQLPMDSERGEVSARYVAHHFTVPAETVAAAKRLARQERGSFFMVLLAGFAILAHEIAGDTDMVVNSLANHRPPGEHQRTAGIFIDFQPLRIPVDDGDTLREVLGRVREVSLWAHETRSRIDHVEHDSPHLHVARPGRAPTTFSYFAVPMRPSTLAFGDHVERIEVADYMGATDPPDGIAWGLATHTTGRVTAKVEFHPAEFRTETVVEWGRRFLTVLEALTSSPDLTVRELATSPHPVPASRASGAAASAQQLAPTQGEA